MNNINVSELLDVGYDVPVLIKDKLLIEPGRWNGILYTAKEIENAYMNTDWKDKEKSSLILDHSDSPNTAVKSWVGYIKNAALRDGSKLYGDLEIWNPLIAMYLTKAKAKFGISAKLKGLQEEGKLKDFTFDNFSIVTKPAVPTTYINLSQDSCSNLLKGGKKMTEKVEENKQSQEEDEDIEEEISEDELETTEELAKKVKKKEYPYPYKENKKKKEEPEEDEEEMSDKELIEYTINSDWTDFVKKMKEKYPDISFKDIAKAYKAKTQEKKKLSELSDTELLETFNFVSELLKKKNKYPYAYEEEAKKKDEEIKKKDEEIKKKDEEKCKLTSEIENKNKEIKELQAKIEIPESKTIVLSQSDRSADPLVEMADFLMKNAGKGGRIF